MIRCRGLWILVAGLLLSTGPGAYAQKKKPASTNQKPKTATKQAKPAATPEKAATAPASDSENEKKVREIVSFLEYLLNTLGSSATSTRDKEVVIRESYSKIFRDDKVQVEDDLENREVVTNKDVVAYLKDVDFFFNDVRFELNIESIQGGGTDNNKQFYKVVLQRNLKGTTLEGEEVNSTIPRFIEVNYDPDADGLKIASMYTKGSDEKVALTAWWNDLSYEWKAIFQRKMNFAGDSLAFAEIQRAAAIDSLDLSNNLYIRSLEPLAELSQLRYLNLSATTISDLTPIRNLAHLVDLSVSGTGVTDLQPIRYAASLQRLNISHTGIQSTEPLHRMPAMQWLDAGHSRINDLTFLPGMAGMRHLVVQRTPVQSIAGVSNLQKMEYLDVSATEVTDLSPLGGLQMLAELRIDSTRVRDLRPLASVNSLKHLSANNSRIDNLEPLKALPALERIYCDQTQIVRSVADAFMAARPSVLVIYDSKDLISWWEALSPGWKQVLLPGKEVPAKDELARLANSDSLRIGDGAAIDNLEPVKRLPKLRSLNIAGSAVTDLSPLRDLKEVVKLDISNTDISDVGPLRMWKNLAVLKANNTKIQNIDPLASLASLEELYVDDTGINDLHAQAFLERNPDCLVVYKTYHVQRWWSRLPETWKTVFVPMLKTSEPRTNDLHKLVETTALSVTEVPVDDLTALSEFVRLEEIRLSGTAVRDLSPLATFGGLKRLHVTNSPVQELDPLARLTSLEDLDFSGTGVDDLRPIRGLTNLKKISCAGTLVRKLDPMEDMALLEYVDCSNTSVSQLDPIAHLPLRTVKCFNSRVSKREAERLRERGVEVVTY
jgi:Leucine-rich repeat (LRR) protein